MTLTELEKKYYLCQPLTKKEWQALAQYWCSQLIDLQVAIKQCYALLKEQKICVDCFKDVPQFSALLDISSKPQNEVKQQ
jgi:hypothetical protein